MTEATQLNNSENVQFIQKHQRKVKQCKQSINGKQINLLLLQFYQNIQKYKFPYIIFLHRRQFFQNLLRKQSNTPPHQITKQRNQIIRQVYKICPILFQLQSLSKIIQHTVEYKNIIKETKPQKNANQPLLSNYQLMINIMNEQDGQIKRNKMKQIISKLLTIKINQKQKQKMCFEQIAANYIKNEVEKMRVITMQNPKICCKVIYFCNQSISPKQDFCYQFKNYSWPICNDNIKLQVKKTITGFMNSKGGVMFLGIKQEQSKYNSVTGVKLTPQGVKEITFGFTEFVNDIYPKHQGFQKCQKQQFEQKINQQQNPNCFVLNDFITLQFIPTTNKETFLDIHQTDSKNQIVQSLYVMKVIVKKGHPKHIYHLINQKGQTLDFYYRNADTVQKKPFHQIYELIYKNLQNYKQIKQSIKTALNTQLSKSPNSYKELSSKKNKIFTQLQQKKSLQINSYQFHTNCQYNLNLMQLIFKQDQSTILQNDSDDDDNDDVQTDTNSSV